MHNFIAVLREKEGDLTQSYDKTPFTNRKFENQKTTHKRHQKLCINLLWGIINPMRQYWLMIDVYWNRLAGKICISFANVDVIYWCLQNFAYKQNIIINLINALSCVIDMRGFWNTFILKKRFVPVVKRSMAPGLKKRGRLCDSKRIQAFSFRNFSLFPVPHSLAKPKQI